MHFSKIENIVIGNQFLGIEVFSNENTEKVDVILVQKKKEELNVKDYYSFSSLETIALNKLASIPVILTVNTEKVLMKEIDIVEKNDLILVKKAFTNLNLDDFYYDIWRFESKSFVFIVRKNYLDDLVHRLTNACHLKIVSVYIGISTFKNIIHYVSQDTINFNGKTYVKSTQNVTNTDLLPQKVYDIGSIKIKGENILCFSGIVSFVTFNYGIGSIKEFNIITKDNFFQNTFFKKLSQYIIFGLLIILLINYMFFSYYFNKYESVLQKNNQEIALQSKIQSLKKNVLDKEKKLKEIALTSSEKVTNKINEISQLIPNTILLDEFQYQPILKKGKEDNLSIFDPNKIVIKGITTDAIDFTNWIESLSQQKFIKEVTIIDFGKNESQELSFIIYIYLNETK